MKRIAPLIVAALALASPSFAQSAPASDIVPVFADITPSLGNFEIQDFSPMTFGNVRIPRASNSVCRYVIAPDGNIGVREVTKTGEAVSSTAPTPGGCQQSGEVSSAAFGITCQAGEAVQYQITHTSAGLPGLGFSSTAGGSPNVLRVVSGFDFASDSSTLVGDRATPQGSFACPAGGQASALIAGELRIDDAATPGNGVTVGQVTLSVQY